MVMNVIIEVDHLPVVGHQGGVGVGVGGGGGGCVSGGGGGIGGGGSGSPRDPIPFLPEDDPKFRCRIADHRRRDHREAELEEKPERPVPADASVGPDIVGEHVEDVLRVRGSPEPFRAQSREGKSQRIAKGNDPPPLPPLPPPPPPLQPFSSISSSFFCRGCVVVVVVVRFAAERCPTWLFQRLGVECGKTKKEQSLVGGNDANESVKW